MIKSIWYHEKINFFRRGPALLVIALVAAATVYAGFSGAQWRDTRQETLSSFESEELEKLETWRGKLVSIENGETEPSPYDGNPMSVAFPAVLPTASLGDFAVGHADLHPANGLISPWRNLSSVFGRYQFDNPSTLSVSAFDVASVVILLLPVLMIAVSFDVLASERRRGTLSMVLATPARLDTFVWLRLLFRNGTLWLVALAAMLFLLVVNDSGGNRYERFALWTVVSLAYGVFWFAAIAYCIACFRSAINTAAAMVGVWLIVVLAIPATLATLAEAAYPTPSRLAFLSEIRAAQGNTNRNLAKLTQGFLLDHPELSVGNEQLPAYFRAAFLSNQAARDNTQPILEAYESSRAGREQILQFAQYLSPSVIAQRLLLASAGGNLDRQHRFQSQTREALKDIGDILGPSVVSRNRLTLVDFNKLEPFVFQERPLSQVVNGAAIPLVFIILLSVLIGGLAQRRLARDTLHE